MKSIKYFSATVSTSPEFGEEEMREVVESVNKRDCQKIMMCKIKCAGTFEIHHFDRAINVQHGTEPVWIVTGSFDKLLVSHMDYMSNVSPGYWTEVVEGMAYALLANGLEVHHMRVAEGLEPGSHTEDIIDIVSDEMRELCETGKNRGVQEFQGYMRSSYDSRPQSIP